MNKPSKDRVDEIVELLQEATKYPWSTTRSEVGVQVEARSDEWLWKSIALVFNDADRALIKAAPELLAWCVEEITRLRRQRDDA